MSFISRISLTLLGGTGCYRHERVNLSPLPLLTTHQEGYGTDGSVNLFMRAAAKNKKTPNDFSNFLCFVSWFFFQNIFEGKILVTNYTTYLLQLCILLNGSTDPYSVLYFYLRPVLISWRGRWRIMAIHRSSQPRRQSRQRWRKTRNQSSKINQSQKR